MKQVIKTIGSMLAMSAMIVFAASCAKETLSEEAQEIAYQKGVERTINAGVQLPTSSATDKAFINTSTKKVFWEIGDEININGTTLSAYDVDNSLANPEARFQGTVHALNTDPARNIYWAVYPASLAKPYTTGIPIEFAASGFTYNIPASQDFVCAGGSTNVMQGNTYMAAYANVADGETRLRFAMHNLGSILHLVLSPEAGTVVTNTRVSRIEFTTTDGALAGDFTLGTDTTTVTPAADAAKALTVNLGTPNTPGYVDIANGADVYVILPPMTRKQLTMKIYNDEGYYTQKTAAAISLARNHIYTTTVDDITFDATDPYFSVSPTKKVVFSPGNLQWSPSGTHNTAAATGVAGTFRFAPNQWDFIGADNENIVNIDQSNVSASTYTGWIDLLGWGTSGYHNASDIHCTHWQPYHYSAQDLHEDENYNLYGYGPSVNMADPDLVGTSAYYDWGIYNDIYNPSTGNTDVYGTWRLLSYLEWDYLAYRRTTASGIRFAKATVNGIAGLLLLPDQWKSSIYTLVDCNTRTSSYSSNVITLADWRMLESRGCVFLPGACYRDNNVFMRAYETDGYYWLSTHLDATGQHAYRFVFSNIAVDDNYNGNRYRGESVRLVKEYVQ
ncbi:MAG: hypothetical protein IJP95_07350 [Bacteroidales bacterium]|nr:hypothetical protein [Bacteroidales bacterium]